MKILIITPYFSPHIGGVEAYTLNMAIRLKKLGWQVVIVTTNEIGARASVDHIEGLKVYRLKTVLKISNTPIGFIWRHKLKQIYKSEKPDVINAHTPVPYFADVAERASGSIPFVLTYHNDIGKDSFPYKQIVWLLHTVFIKRTLKRAHEIIATSEYYVNQSEFLKPYSNKISIVPPGVDLARFNPEISYQSIEPRYKGKRIILFVGSMDKAQKHKGVDTLIKAFERIHIEFPDTKLVVIGSGDAAATYKAQANTSGLANDIDFTGYITDKKLAEYYKLASVLVLPSANNNEGFGMVFIEAGAVGTPVIGTRVGGIPYAIKDNETGLVIKPKSVISLQNAIRSILSDHGLASQLGEAGALRAATSFDWDLLAARTKTILLNALKPTIIQVAGYYPPHLGGMEKVAKTVSEELAERGYNVEVMTTNIPQSSPTVQPLPRLHMRRFKAFEFAHTPIAPAFSTAIFHIPKHSVIHLHLAQAYFPELVLFAASVRKIPYVVHFHLDLQPTGSLGLLFLLYKSVVLRKVIQKADAVIVFSDEQRTFIHDKYGVGFQNIRLIANGVGDEYFIEPKAAKNKNHYQLLYVGRLQAQKRVNILIEMVAAMKSKVVLRIIGDGEDRHELEELAHSHGLTNVHFEGQIAPHEIIRHYRNSNALVIASENEGMPLAVLEAMAASLPIVAAEAPGLSELVQGVGILVHKPSGETFAMSVDSLLKNPSSRDRLAKASYATARSYSWSNTVDALEELYKKVSQ